MEEQVVVIYAGVNGYLDKVQVSDIGRYEKGLLGEARANGNEILDAVRTSGDLSADTEAKLKAMLERYTQRFAA
jgi:F-type H+-transporting ATPase subunit alpha